MFNSRRLLILYLTYLTLAFSFIWKLNDEIEPSKTITFSEKYMFKTNNGPKLLANGDSFIETDTAVIIYMKKNISFDVVITSFVSEPNHHHDSLLEMCQGQSYFIQAHNQWTSDVHTKRFTNSKYAGVFLNTNPQDVSATKLPINIPLFVWKTSLKSKVYVHQEGWHSVAFQLCSKDDVRQETKSNSRITINYKNGDGDDDNADSDIFQYGYIVGNVIFRNPYGYIPAEMYGFLPFEAARMLSYILLGLVLLYHYCRFSESVLLLHNAVLAVYIVAFVESILWFVSYQHINLTGEPYCCPFPSLIVGSLILQVFRQTFSRTLLLVVSLGYGIVRPKLLQTEWLSIFAISVLYFTAATVAQISEITLTYDMYTKPSVSHSSISPGNINNESTTNMLLQYTIPALIMDALFLTWIFFALSSTKRILLEFQQTYKLSMYNKLSGSIIFFVILFGMVTFFIFLDKLSLLHWPWQWTWLQQVLWEALNFGVLASVCVICLPSKNSQYLSYTSQVPTEDPDDEGNINEEDSIYSLPHPIDHDSSHHETGTRNQTHVKKKSNYLNEFGEEEDEEDVDFDFDAGFEIMNKKFPIKNSTSSNSR